MIDAIAVDPRIALPGQFSSGPIVAGNNCEPVGCLPANVVCRGTVDLGTHVGDIAVDGAADLPMNRCLAGQLVVVVELAGET